MMICAAVLDRKRLHSEGGSNCLHAVREETNRITLCQGCKCDIEPIAQ